MEVLGKIWSLKNNEVYVSGRLDQARDPHHPLPPRRAGDPVQPLRHPQEGEGIVRPPHRQRGGAGRGHVHLPDQQQPNEELGKKAKIKKNDEY